MSLIKVNQLSTLDETTPVTALTGIEIPTTEDLSVQGRFLDSNGLPGETGQYLVAINGGSGTSWQNLPQGIGSTDVTFTNILVTGNIEVQGTADFLLTAFTTSDLAEGARLYYTDERVDDRVAALIDGGTGISTTYDDAGNLLTISAEFSEYDTDSVVEGTTNLFYTDARVHASLSVDNTANETGDPETTGYGSLSYDSAGLYTYAGPTRADFRASISESNSGGFGSISYDSASGVMTYSGITQTQIRQQVSVSNLSGYGTLAYSTTGGSAGQIQFTGISDSEIRNRFGVSNPDNTGLSTTDVGYSWGNINLDTGTGVFAYAGPTTGDIRSLISVSGDLNYNATTGVLNYTAAPASPSQIYDLINTSPNLLTDPLDTTDGLQNLHVNNDVYQLAKPEQVVVASNVATVTTQDDHLYTVNDRVKLINTGNAHLDGIYTVTATPTSDTFRFTSTNVPDGTYLSPAVDSTSIVAGSGYGNGTFGTTSGTGSGLTVDITTSGGEVQTVIVNNLGDGQYTNGDELTITGGDNNATFRIFVAESKRPSLFTGDLVVEGSLNVNGSKIGLSDLFVGTSLIRLNSDLPDTQAPSTLGDDDAVIEVNRGLLDDTAIRWNEATGRWQFSNDGINYNNMLLPSETDFGAPEEFGASGDPSRYDVTAVNSVFVDGLTRTVLTVDDVSKFRTNHNIKVFGISSTQDLNNKFASLDGTPQNTTSANPTPNGQVHCYAYVTALMDVNTGDISGCYIPSTSQAVKNNAPFNMNEDNYNVIDLIRPNGNYAVLLYRFVATDPNEDLQPAINALQELGGASPTNRDDFRLIAVVGEKYFAGGNNIQYQDYAAYDVTRNSLRNRDPDPSVYAGTFGADSANPRADEIHIPHTPNLQGQHRHGFITSDILTISAATNQIVLRGAVWSEIEGSDPNEDVVTLYNDLGNANGTGDVYVYHDDTKPLQKAIDDSKANGRDFLVIPGGTYLITQLVLPDRFTLRGLADATILHRQYWNTDKLTSADVSINGSKGNMLKSINFDGADVATAGPVDCSLGDVVFDGSAKYQILSSFSNFDSGVETQTNDAVINAINSQFFRMTNVKVRQSAGPALVAGGAENLSIDGCVFYNGADQERFITPCIVADEGDTTIISNCVFRDFPGPVILNSTNVLAVNGCTIRNCGSGLRIYAASKTDVLNNLILGPADEYIPVPDNYDSDFNGVNLIASTTEGDNLTPVLQYIEEGEGVDLTNVNLRAQVLPVTVAGGVETFGSPIKRLGSDVISYQQSAIINGQQTNTDPTIGQTLFNITQPNLQEIINVNPPAANAYNVWRAFGIRYVDIGSDVDFTIIGARNVDPVLNGNYYLEVTKELYDTLPSNGGAWIKISSSHTYNPDITVDGELIWEVTSKTTSAGPTYILELLPQSEDAEGNIGPANGILTSVGASAVSGYASIRNAFTIAKGIVSISN